MGANKIACYVRVSTQEQATKGHSIGEQTERLKAYCAAMKWDDVKIYSDPGFSGASLDRPGIQSLIADVQAGSISKVIVYKLDRLSRSQKDTLYLIEDVFLKHDVGFISISESFDTATPLGKAAIGMLSVFAQLEREQIKERMIMGKEARAKKGLYHGAGYSPFGYDYKDGQLIINHRESAIVKEIFNRYLNGHNFFKIARELTIEGLAPKSGLWNAQTIQNILNSKTYIGYIRHKDQWIPGQHSPILDNDIFEAVQDRLERRQINKRLSHTNPAKSNTYLGGLLFCKQCGRKYYKQSIPAPNNGRYNYYVCDSKKHGKHLKTNCSNRYWRMETLNDIVFDEVRKLNIKKTKSRKKEKIDIVAQLKAEIIKIDRSISKLVDAYSLTEMPAEILQEKINALNAKKKEAEHRLEDATEKTKKKNDLSQTIKDFNDVLVRGDMPTVQGILRDIIDCIYVDGDNIEIKWNI